MSLFRLFSRVYHFAIEFLLISSEYLLKRLDFRAKLNSFESTDFSAFSAKSNNSFVVAVLIYFRNSCNLVASRELLDMSKSQAGRDWVNNGFMHILCQMFITIFTIFTVNPMQGIKITLKKFINFAQLCIFRRNL